MGQPFASLSGQRVVSGSLFIPLYGMWSGDVQLVSTDDIPDNGPLVVGNLQLICNVYRQAVFAGSRDCRLVAGYGGWRKPLPAKHYSLAGGVKRSLVLADAALEVGEKINVPSDSTIGTGYARAADAASLVLRHLAGSNWYIDPAGVTQVRPWPTAKVTSPFTIVDQTGSLGIVEVATEDYASWMPGCTFTSATLDGTFTNCGTMFTFDAEGKFRLQVMTK